MASSQQAGSPQAALALLHAIVRRDLPAFKRALADGAALQWKGIPALHVCALCDWPETVPLLLSHGADLQAWLQQDGSAEASTAAVARLQGMGVPDELCRAVLPLEARKTALALAVRCGAAATVSALLAAGACADGAFRQLVQLATWKTEQLGRQAAAAAVPALVHQCAAALLALPLPQDGPVPQEAHTAAVRLAFPSAASEGQPESGSHPACPWLLQQLQQLHVAGQMPQPEEGIWAACDALLACAEARGQPVYGTLAVTLAAWLRLPACSSVPGSRLASVLSQVCGNGMVAARRALLALEPLQAELRAEAEQPLALGAGPASDAAPLVYSAACSGRTKVLDAVLAAGGAVTLNAVIRAACCAVSGDPGALTALKLLLRHGQPPVPLDGAALPAGPHSPPGYTSCPIYAVLDRFHAAMDEALEDATEEADESGEPPSEAAFHAMHWRALRAIECLADAGYRPSTFTNYTKPLWLVGQRLPTYSPAEDRQLAERWELDTSGRWLWMAARREPWSPESHASFPRAFKQAARTLLLVAHRGAARPDSDAASASSAPAGAAQLARLPRDLLHAVLARAAFPLSPWRPTMDGGRVLESVWGWEDEYSDSDPDDVDSDY